MRISARDYAEVRDVKMKSPKQDRSKYNQSELKKGSTFEIFFLLEYLIL